MFFSLLVDIKRLSNQTGTYQKNFWNIKQLSDQKWNVQNLAQNHKTAFGSETDTREIHMLPKSVKISMITLDIENWVLSRVFPIKFQDNQ